jgi:hypothetical protein
MAMNAMIRAMDTLKISYKDPNNEVYCWLFSNILFPVKRLILVFIFHIYRPLNQFYLGTKFDFKKLSY